jgi:hypothetical protein
VREVVACVFGVVTYAGEGLLSGLSGNRRIYEVFLGMRAYDEVYVLMLSKFVDKGSNGSIDLAIVVDLLHQL